MARNFKMYSKNDSRVERRFSDPIHDKENANPPSESGDDEEKFSGRIFREVKSTASRTFSNVINRIDHLSQRLRRTAQRKCSTSSLQNYQEFENGEKTPVKLYSPFSIVTPSPQKAKEVTERQNLLVPKRFIFASPTGKLKKDIADLTSGIDELNCVAKSLQRKRKNI